MRFPLATSNKQWRWSICAALVCAICSCVHVEAGSKTIIPASPVIPHRVQALPSIPFRAYSSSSPTPIVPSVDVINSPNHINHQQQQQQKPQLAQSFASSIVPYLLSPVSSTVLPKKSIPAISDIVAKESGQNETTIISTSTTIHHDQRANRSRVDGSNWWILGTRRNYAKYLDITPATYKIACGKVRFLSEAQRELCATGLNVANVVGRGARTGIDECQHQFKMNRWNCSTHTASQSGAGDGDSVFGHVLDINSREKAFIHAIVTAGVVHAVTRACTKGELPSCGCDERIKSSQSTVPQMTPNTRHGAVQGKWEWGGCSDDIHYGAQFSKLFVDSVEDPSTAEGLVNLHNNEAGRRIIKSKMEVFCKCHGMSGSCSVKVCWRKMKPFREVGQDLSARFDGATHVKVIESRKKRSRLRPAHKNVKKPSKRDLVYLEESPDFCFKNATIGAEGTTDRICNATSYGLDGCRYLCCGRGYRTIERQIETKCNCKFVWCCQVKCDKCRSKIIEHRCN